MRIAELAVIVRCANCQTEFSLDDRHVGSEGAPVRCSVCGYVFRVEPRGGKDTTWQVRTIDDLVFAAPDLRTLRTWIAEGRLHPDDRVSRTGRHWLRLGDMPELASGFVGFATDDVVVEESTGAMAELGPPPGFGETPASEPGRVELTSPPAPTGPIDLDLAALTFREPGLREALRGTAPRHVLSVPIADDDEDSEPLELVDRPDEPARTASLRGGDPRANADVRPVDEAPVSEAAATNPRLPIRVARTTSPGMPGTAGNSERQGPRAGEFAGRTVPLPELPPALTSGPMASMLGSVTAHVQPITRPHETVPLANAPTPTPTPPAPPTMGPGPATRLPDSATTAAGTDASQSGSLVAPQPSRRRRRRSTTEDEIETHRRAGWRLWAGLGLLAGIAVVFGVPAVRARVFGMGEAVVGPAETPPDYGPTVQAARDVMHALSPKEMDRVDAELTAAIESDPAAPLVAARAELRSTRALQDAIAAALAQRAVQPELAAAAEQALSSADATDPTVARAHVLLALARGIAPPVAGVAFSSAPGEELARVSAAAPLWRDAEAAVPDGAIAGLEGLSDRGALATMVLAIAVLRAGDEARARELADGVLKVAADESIAIALLARIDAAPGSKKEPEVAGDPRPKVRDPGPKTPPGEAKAVPGEAKTPPGTDDATARMSVDALIDRGCAKVEGGAAKEGIELLKKAHDRRPADVDAALCLGQGYAKLGSHAKALEFFETALDRSPTMRAALAGAGKAASRLGQEKSALQYYRRLLAQDPDHAAASEYVRAHEGGGASPGG